MIGAENIIMDIKHLDYIITLADERSLSIAAQKLSVTQSAISQHLTKLEKSLGVPLFNRTNSEWTLTEEGRLYLDMAREIVRLEERTLAAISERTGSGSGTVRLGLTMGRGPDMFIHIYPDFHREFPQVHLEPMELSTVRMQEEIRKGNIDLGIITLPEHQKNTDTYIDLSEEQIYLCLPDSYPVPSSVNTSEPYPYFPIETLKYEPFVLIYRESTWRWAIDQILNKAKFMPDVLFETASCRTILAMIQAGMCIGFLPEYYVKSKPEGIRVFRLPDSPRLKVSACHRSDSAMTSAEQYLIRLAGEYFRDTLK
ncbi:MAG TPA: transcriptional regulator [Erysipelotrichaceae bacterium]|jgi:DNA-binding transcriptional LysR family regulator|nr:transcriptional regulator [Erysipelotrichaceae bacterium]